ncbi:ketohydroxyglutarate aldolase [Malaciobacter pacificus]|uniref:2-dehydro-3-deoxy-phosphogluconate aldolase n=1 Tax=Malaciobacter pacificus TaxID=1080223 RepID=A0A5C2HE64_9BACT|nr:bifunctional 4-hydroxy-2-oxoglutarate aldolase/2-dehydro-3-deoxy-phosphogluconate aldolase [Malaciobacter pacificus]QEP35084.1 multifunctional 2-keto-3-deoxygluconate 6-phosphate aldolase and 2-keto-4-hydroxyglutarate aldolase and oxaloacetate decarboxylase [Malaciobacter pacificus]GGD36851.1 ketohydroxyglutarate aldolase [Malaciobacter pacificus]
MSIEKIIGLSPIIPVIVIKDVNDAVPLAKALLAGGIDIMEVTLRTNTALKAIELIAKEVPDMNVGAGTVCNEEDLIEAKKVGAKFVFSPGISKELIEASHIHEITLVPGVATASEVMLAQNNDIFFCKLFPASIVGGIKMLKALGGPFPKMRFCPTGGVNLDNMNEFLELENVLCIGGSWIVPDYMLKNKEFDKITQLCKEGLEKIKE